MDCRVGTTGLIGLSCQYRDTRWTVPVPVIANRIVLHNSYIAACLEVVTRVTKVNGQSYWY